MKQITNIQRATNYLAKIFKYINEEYFNNELETPTITIQTSVGAYGHITTSKVWSNDNVTSYELNIGAETINRPIENVVATLMHESVHLYCLMNDIKDTSNRGIYHNKTFKKLAEEMCGLQIDKHEKYGWTITTPTEETIDFCIRYSLEDIQIHRQGAMFTVGTATPTRTTTTTPRTSSTRKYICPCCGNSFRATKIINVMCMDCNEQFVLA